MSSWCDIHERQEKGRTQKVGNEYASVYVCATAKRQLDRMQRREAKLLAKLFSQPAKVQA